MCTLLNMCLPFEVRYLGTCVEDIGRRDYNELRESEHHANSASDLAELTTLGVGDQRTRRKLALYMALLHSCNYACALIHHKILSNLESQEISGILNGVGYASDDHPLDELLLLYTMALNHPAFTYEQKTTFGNIYLKLQEEEASRGLSKTVPAVNSSYKTAQVMLLFIIIIKNLQKEVRHINSASQQDISRERAWVQSILQLVDCEIR